MDEHAFTNTATIIVAVFLMAVATSGAGVAVYLSDPTVEATILETHCAGPDVPPYTIDLETKLLALRVVVEVNADQCFVIQKANFVQYSVRSGRTVIYDEEGGECLWDTNQFIDPDAECGA